MPAWKRICCPVEFSQASRFAMEAAAELAWRFGGELTLLHVDDRPAPAPPPETLASGEALAFSASPLELERELEAWRDAAGRIASAPVHHALRAGDPAQEILRFAREGRYDALVMGTHGRSERDRLALGSVAEAVLREAPCPVVVIRGRASGPADRVVER